MDEEKSLEQLASEAISDECDSVTNHSNVTVSQRERPTVLSADVLMQMKFPPRLCLLSPWLTTQSLTMLYAPRGIGKTHVAMGIAYALATGGTFLHWKADAPVRVLYLDGEMPGADLQARLKRIHESVGGDIGDRLQIMTPDAQLEGIMPNLYSPIGRDDVTDAATNADVIIVDNISALVRGGKENESESWDPVAAWALSMRVAGKSVLFVHHAGKGGAQRGTSKREDLLDTVIALRRPQDYEPEEGARFEIHFEKARGLMGDDVAAMEARLTTTTDGKQTWDLRSADDCLDEQLLELLSSGMTQERAAGELCVSRRTIIRHCKRLEAEGRYKPKPKKPKAPSVAQILQ